MLAISSLGQTNPGGLVVGLVCCGVVVASVVVVVASVVVVVASVVVVVASLVVVGASVVVVVVVVLVVEGLVGTCPLQVDWSGQSQILSMSFH